MENEQKIIAAIIKPDPATVRSLGEHLRVQDRDARMGAYLASGKLGGSELLLPEMPTVYVKYVEGEEFERLFTYYPDEISFAPAEFIGLTEREARTLFHRKDVDYLKS